MPFIIGIPCAEMPYKSDIPCTSETEAIAFAAGISLAQNRNSRLPMVFMQNSGFGNSIDIIASLLKPYNIPVKIMVSNRKDPEQHKVMGEITEFIMEALNYETLGCYTKHNVKNFVGSGYHIYGDDLKGSIPNKRPPA